MNGGDAKLQSSGSKCADMNNRGVIAILLKIFLSLYPMVVLSSQVNNPQTSCDNVEFTYNVETNVRDSAKVSIFTIKLKCRTRTDSVVSCRLVEPQYQTNYHESTCSKSSGLCGHEHFRADNSYIGQFEFEFRGGRIERLMISSLSSLKQLSFYRLMAGHLVPGVDMQDEPTGTYSMNEESVYGRCETLVTVIRQKIKKSRLENGHDLKTVLCSKQGINKTMNESEKSITEILSIKKMRNLNTCQAVPGLLIFDHFFDHPMMTSVHYDIKSSVSRIITNLEVVLSYTIEDIAMRNIKQPDGNTTMLNLLTILNLHSIDVVDTPIRPIYDPISVELPFLSSSNSTSKAYNHNIDENMRKNDEKDNTSNSNSPDNTGEF